MSDPLSILILEDSKADAELVLRELRRVGLDFRWRRVETEPAFIAALADPPGLILSDYSMPQFDGLRALTLLREQGLDIPFILISGTLGEEVAVEAIKRGATDYLLKDRIARLGSAVYRALEERQLRVERRRMENSLRDAEARLRLAVEASNIGAWDWNLRTNEVYFSPEWKRQLGYADHELTNQFFEWESRLHPDDHDRILARAVAFQSDPAVDYDVEFRLRHKDGSYRWIHTKAMLQHDVEGRAIRMLGCHVDITGQKESEEKIQRLNRLYAVSCGINEAIVRIKDRQKLYERACRIAVELGGLRMAWVGLASADEGCITPVAWSGDNDGYLDSLRISISADEPSGRGPAGEAFRQGTGVHRNDISTDPGFATRDAANHRGYQSCAAFPLRIADRSMGVFVVYADQKNYFSEEEMRLLGALADNLSFALDSLRAEEKLREQAALLDKAQDAILVRDLDNRITYWNRGAERLYGWTAGEAAGRLISELLYRDPVDFKAATVATLSKGEWVGELIQVTKDGRSLSVEGRWTLVYDDHGEPCSILAINTDITEKKKLESQFMRAQRMESIGTLAGGIAHDLNNILAPILVSIELISDEVPSEGGKAMLGTLRSCARRGADLVRQVLGFARGIEGERMEVNVGHLIREIWQITRETFPKNIEIVCQVERNLGTVIGDPTQLHQVFMNLCVNARDAMSRGGRLQLRICNVTLDDCYAGMSPDAKPGSYLLIEVTNTGTGIPVDVRGRIFEPFYTTKDKGKGTGLGLSTTLAIVRSHGGGINVYSEPGQGTTFRVYLPAKPGRQTEEKPADEKPDLPRGHGETILLVDDEAGIREVMRKTLERFGYRVILASHGAEAVVQYAQLRDSIAVVITDMAMPVMDGASTIAALQAMNPKVTIIASSGHGTDEKLDRARRAGAVCFVPKPYSAETILKALAQVLLKQRESTS